MPAAVREDGRGQQGRDEAVKRGLFARECVAEMTRATGSARERWTTQLWAKATTPVGTGSMGVEEEGMGGTSGETKGGEGKDKGERRSRETVRDGSWCCWYWVERRRVSLSVITAVGGGLRCGETKQNAPRKTRPGQRDAGRPVACIFWRRCAQGPGVLSSAF